MMVCDILAHKSKKKSGSSRSFSMLDTFHARQSAGGSTHLSLAQFLNYSSVRPVGEWHVPPTSLRR
jgi:hypothetical protein